MHLLKRARRNRNCVSTSCKFLNVQKIVAVIKQVICCRPWCMSEQWRLLWGSYVNLMPSAISGMHHGTWRGFKFWRSPTPHSTAGFIGDIFLWRTEPVQYLLAWQETWSWSSRRTGSHRVQVGTWSLEALEMLLLLLSLHFYFYFISSPVTYKCSAYGSSGNINTTWARRTQGSDLRPKRG